MSQVLRIDNDDPRVAYQSGWTSSLFGDQTFTVYFSILFRGTGIKFYGFCRGGPSRLIQTLDGAVSGPLNCTDFANVSSLVFGVEDLADGDHLYHMYSERADARIAVDYFEIENSYGGGFDILSTGPTATDVPVQAVVVDDTSSDIVFQNYSRWFHREDITCSGRTVSFSKGGGTSLSYSFDGVAIWYYGTRSSDTGFFAVSVDGSTPQRFNGSGYPARYQQMLWSNTRLGPGRHTITLTLDDEDNKDLSLDFFRILREKDASVLLSTTLTTSSTALTTESQPVTVISKPNTVPLAIGLALGLLALVTFVLGGVCYLYHRRRRETFTGPGLEVYPASPYAVPPMTQADQQPGLSQDRKGPPQYTRLSVAPTDTGSLGLSELGPPPSYRGREQNGSVDEAE